MLFIYCNPGLNKQLDSLRKAGGRTALVAGHVDSIIRELTSSRPDPRSAGRITRNGEARIRECVKYDLVDSYRLVGIIRDDSLILSFVGTHDECDRWIKGHQRTGFSWKKRNRLASCAHTPDAAAWEPGEDEAEPAREEEDPFMRIGEVDLRKIFHGLAHE
ncbi:MAG: hypothetical protein ABFD98_02330 [Syntrophobacteraceae bacterium]|nr:hypothetical protein [Desulfobacteraceae bacterium]